MSQIVRAPAELLSFLFTAWPDSKKTKVKQWLKSGAVRVNGVAITQFNHALEVGDRVEISEAKASISAQRLPPGLRVVFEDEHLLVVEKPEGLLSMASESESNATAYAHLTAYVRGAAPRSKARVWIVHRLDRETSGLMIFAKSEQVQKTLERHWAQVDKRYWAVVEGVPKDPQGTLESHLDEMLPHKVFSSSASHRTREARTHYRVLKRNAQGSLVELKLDTGRRHQIRVQLSDIGCPCIGDEKYGARTNPARRLGLHARQLSFPHPVTGVALRFESPLPPALERVTASMV